MSCFVSGCFDLLHAGHLELFEHARSIGNFVIVSVASDDTLRALKREPIIAEHDRCRMVEALRCVDRVFIARGEPSHRDCFPYVRSLRPTYWLIDHADPHRPEKEALAVECGTRIVLNYRPEHGLTTTGLIEKIQSLRG